MNGDLYLEVKTPLVQMQTEIPPYVPRLPETPFSSTERALRHLRELAASLANHERAAVLYCLYYDNFGFRFFHGTTYEEVLATVDTCRSAGVELWQADFEVTPEGIALRAATNWKSGSAAADVPDRAPRHPSERRQPNRRGRSDAPPRPTGRAVVWPDAPTRFSRQRPPSAPPYDRARTRDRPARRR